ncbi:juvenile hormone acid O-methyltransferase-like [Coccinella septempunctata]|uniref:juvenile hormone acid O-methyltransferase-like n=1 Tax=Coccinella septempunctata TaxID=41139 RepID=UPI001D0815D9|nr:juvenile hormone acid O-methyltransferase-like [Coccinella septempunctata]
MGVSPEKFQKVVFLLEFVPKIFREHADLFKFTKKNNFSMIDIGTGPGTMLLQIENQLPKHYKEIIGTDRAETMIEYFDSVPKDSRITSRILDISAEKMPADLTGRFDFAFSSFCFGYVPDLRKTFKNCNELLKPEGETFFAWSIRSHIPEIYRSLSKIDKWAPYTSDYKNWKSLIEYEDPIGTLSDHLKAAGLEKLKIAEYEDFAFQDPEDVMLETFESQDHIRSRIPQIDQQMYKEEFDRIVRTEQIIYGQKPKIPFPSVAVIAKKN